jgi:hypothetical protein
MEQRSERRQSERLPSDFATTFQPAWPFDVMATGHSRFEWKQPEQGLQGTAANISYRDGAIGGIFITTDNPPPRGTVLEVSFMLDAKQPRSDPLEAPPLGNLVGGFHGSCNCRAVVRWRREWSAIPGMGLALTELRKEDQSQVAQWVEQNAQRTSGAEVDQAAGDPMATQLISIPPKS